MISNWYTIIPKVNDETNRILTAEYIILPIDFTKLLITICELIIYM